MRDAPFFFLVRLCDADDGVIASDEVHFEAGTNPDATQAAEEAGAFFSAEPHWVDEEKIEAGVVKVYGPFYLHNPMETKLAASEGPTGWDAV